MSKLKVDDVALLLDHALLSPQMTEGELEAGIEFALKNRLASICILPHYLQRCALLVKGSSVKASTTVGFPHGAISSAAKLYEAQDALDNGCQELDVVVNISRVLSGDWDYVHDELSDIIEACHTQGQHLKVIFENCYLEEKHKLRLIAICSDLGADWIKTSTGFGPSGANLEDVAFMRQHSPNGMGIKASGGIADLATLLKFHSVGASRIGTSHSAKILQEAQSQQEA